VFARARVSTSAQLKKQIKENIMQKKLIPCALALALVSAFAHAESAKRYIVQYHDTAVQSPLRAEAASAAAADARVAANVQAWGYVDSRVLAKTQELESRHGVKAKTAFSHTIKGFAAALTPAQVAALQADPSVASVEEDLPVKVNAQTIPWGISYTQATVSTTLAGNGSGAVTGSYVYVIDTGIATHPDLNLIKHVNMTTDGMNYDCHGHGTHVAGTIGAKDDAGYVVGMAPGVKLTGVKVLGCTGSGYTSDVIKGVDWVTANAVKPAVANMSVGGVLNTTLNAAIQKSVAAGVFYAVAAGNDNANSCNYSPSSVGSSTAGAITVGSISSTGASASSSNWGSCVEVYAPGVSVLSTYLSNGTATMSGTSMATPHVTGAAALYRSRYPTATPAAVETAIKNTAVSTGQYSQSGALIKSVNVKTF
jgi:subtilisin family serine protease